MLLTGRHNQTTGYVTNFVTTRHDEIGIGDAFARAGYRTAWIGKWHLHVGSYPSHRGPDYVPEGRDRLGFQHWRGYDFHADREWVEVSYRRYLAMTLALDDMVGEMLDNLEHRGVLDDTIFVFTSDRGSRMGAHHADPWMKCLPYEESILVPMVVRWPGVLKAGRTCDTLVAPVDVLPSLCGLCAIPVPRSIEGYDVSDAWRGVDGAFEQEAVLTMNFLVSAEHNLAEWRGVRTKKYSYVRWLNGKAVLYDLENDPLQKDNLARDPEAREIRERMENRLREPLSKRHDEFSAWTEYDGWLDNQRRIVRNAYGRMRHPESEPDWSLLT